MTRGRLALAATLALLAAGCGGGGGNRQLGEGEYREDFSAICADAAADIEEVMEEEDEPANSALGSERLADEALADLQALEGPDEIAGGVGELIELLDQQVVLYGQLADAEEDGDDDAAAAIEGRLDDLADEIEGAASAADIDCEPDDIDPAEQLSD